MVVMAWRVFAGLARHTGDGIDNFQNTFWKIYYRRIDSAGIEFAERHSKAIWIRSTFEFLVQTL